MRVVVGVLAKFEVIVDVEDKEQAPEVALKKAEELLAGHKIVREWWEYYFEEGENRETFDDADAEF